MAKRAGVYIRALDYAIAPVNGDALRVERRHPPHMRREEPSRVR